jgi:hypothetical protein
MRLDPHSSLLCVVDIQERLLAAMPAAAEVVARSVRLARGATLLGVGSLLVEQYPRGLGSTPGELAAALPPAVAKMTFSCAGCEAFAAALTPGIGSVVLCGLETHVCISQTALDLLARGLNVFVAVDAVASRHAVGALRMVPIGRAPAVPGGAEARAVDRPIVATPPAWMVSGFSPWLRLPTLRSASAAEGFTGTGSSRGGRSRWALPP